MSITDDEGKFLIHGGYISPGLDSPKVFYTKYLFYSKLYLQRGVELWNSNPIKYVMSHIDYRTVYYSNKIAEESDIDLRLCKINDKLLTQLKKFLLEKSINLDIPFLMMGMSVERVLKGLLLNNGFIIHKNNSGLTRIGPNAKAYTKLNKEVYSLEEFTEKFEILEAALMGETKESIQVFKVFLLYLKNLRDKEAHLACKSTPLQIYDLILFKLVDNLMNKAVKAFNIADKKLEDSLEWTNKSNSLNSKSSYKKALKYAEKALEINPLLKEAKINKGNSLLGLKNYAGAIECYDEVIAIDPSTKEAFNNKGNALQMMGKYDESIKNFEKAIELDQKYTAPFSNMGNALNELGKYKEAIEYLDKAIELDPLQEEAWAKRGIIQLNLGLYNEALESFDRIIEISPRDAMAWFGKGDAASMMKRYDMSIEFFDKSIKLNPKLICSWIGRGFALNAIGHYKESDECYNKITEIDPNMDVSPLLKEIWFNRGNELLSRRMYSDAATCYDKIIELDPMDTNAWNNKGLSLIRSGSYDQALLCFERSNELNQSAIVWYEKSIAFRCLNDYDNALDSCRKALEIDSECMSARISLAACYRKLNYKEEFIRECEIISKSIDKETEYNRACFKIITDNIEEGLALLKGALEKDFLDLDWVCKDPDLESIRDTPAFCTFIKDFSGK